MQINLIQHDPAFNFVQSIDMYRKTEGGHANLTTVEDVQGGYKGGSFELSVSSRGQALRIHEGHCISAWQDGWPVYAGRVLEVDNTGDGWRIGMMGLVQLFGQKVADIVYNAKSIYQILTTLLTNVGFGSQLSTDIGYISANGYVLGERRNNIGQLLGNDDVKFSKSTIQNIWDTCNAFAGWEYGAVLYDNLNPRDAKTIMYYWPADTTSLYMNIDASSLKTQPILKPDFRSFGTWARVYWGQAGQYEDIHGKVVTMVYSNGVDIAAHGFATGDAIRVFNQNGNLLPAPLNGYTTYYAIRWNADFLQFATTLANANAGTYITLTTYGTGAHSVQYYPNPSEEFYGEMIYPMDIGSETSSARYAGQAGQMYLDALMQDGMYRPPMTVDITLDTDARIDNPRGAVHKNIWRLRPGENVLLSNLKDAMVRDLQYPVQPAFVHVLEMQRDYGAGQVKLRCRRGFDPAVILARAKGGI